MPETHTHDHAEHGSLAVEDRHAHESEIYDAMAETMLAEMADDELRVQADRIPFHNREHVDYLSFAIDQLRPLAGKRILEVGAGERHARRLAGAAGRRRDRHRRVRRHPRRRGQALVDQRRVPPHPLRPLRRSRTSTIPTARSTPSSATTSCTTSSATWPWPTWPACSSPTGERPSASRCCSCPSSCGGPATPTRSPGGSRRTPTRRTSARSTSATSASSSATSRSVSWRPFQLLCRLQNFVELSDPTWNRLESIDRFTLRRVPPARWLARMIVLTLETPRPVHHRSEGTPR